MAYAHNNNASRCLIDLDKIIASGTFKNVYEGDYTEGKRAGEKCVSKQFKSGSVHEVDCFSEELRVIKRAQAILDNWYAAHVASRQNRILLNRPEMWEFEDGPQAGIKHLVEPSIDHFEKFNSNTGWAPIVSCTLARRPQTSAVSAHSSCSSATTACILSCSVIAAISTAGGTGSSPWWWEGPCIPCGRGRPWPTTVTSCCLLGPQADGNTNPSKPCSRWHPSPTVLRNLDPS